MSQEEHHILPMKLYVNVFVALLFLTAATVFVAQFDFGSMNTVIAMLVATVKATLVGLYFMHLKYDDKLYSVCLISGVFFLLVMFAFSALDIFSRAAVTSTL